MKKSTNFIEGFTKLMKIDHYVVDVSTLKIYHSQTDFMINTKKEYKKIMEHNTLQQMALAQWLKDNPEFKVEEV